MKTEVITMDRAKARELYQKYKAHQHYDSPIDWEVQRAYQLIAQGRCCIQALESVKAAGLNDQHFPKLAIMRANVSTCFVGVRADGSVEFTSKQWRAPARETIRFRAGSFGDNLDLGLMRNWEGKSQKAFRRDARGIVPIIPAHLRPRRGLANYHVLWEAEWTPIPPRDPLLLRRIGKGDLWLVVAHWDLTEVERAALSTRVHTA